MTAVIDEIAVERGPGRLASGAEAWRNVRRSRIALFGLAIVGVHVLIAILAPLIAPYSPTANNAAAALQSPSWEHLAGTDQLGRDVLSRTLYGGRVTITAALLAAFGAVAIGALVGLFAAYAQRTADEVSMRVVDAVLAVPAILALLMVVTMFGSSILVLVLAVVVIFAPAVVRVVRAAARQVVPLDFVTAAEARGEGRVSVVMREIRPNIHDVLFVEFAIRASWAALVISALSFLGFGVSPPTPDWGLMVAENRTLLSIAPWVSIAPVIALSTLIVGLNLAADGLARAFGLERVSSGRT
jgi:peptide/nickel transport system permease protein